MENILTVINICQYKCITGERISSVFLENECAGEYKRWQKIALMRIIWRMERNRRWQRD